MACSVACWKDGWRINNKQGCGEKHEESYSRVLREEISGMYLQRGRWENSSIYITLYGNCGKPASAFGDVSRTSNAAGGCSVDVGQGTSFLFSTLSKGASG